MAVAVEIDFPGGTLEQYDEVIRKMGFTPGGPGAPGGLFHFVTATDDGFRVVDVWETIEQFQQFSEEKIGPLSREVGFAQEPHVRTTPVHNYLTKG
jgi:hypothetical protein